MTDNMLQEIPLSALLDGEGSIDDRLRAAYALKAQMLDDVEGFEAFYFAIHGRELPEHGRDWIEGIYRAHDAGKQSLIFSWRGSWKTTTISITFTAWRIGKEPHRSNLVVQANDDSASATTEAIADMIANNPWYKAIFPNIEPDREKGWGAGGYEIKRNDIPYEEWRSLNVVRRDATLLGLGIGSKTLIGLHPTGILLLDDIHDEQNTSSQREMSTVLKKLTDTIMPFIVEDDDGSMVTWFVVVGTPWNEGDAYHYLKGTGETVFIKTPVMRRMPDGEGVEISGAQSDIEGWWEITWPEKFSISQISSWRNRTGKRGFWRMFMLDLTVSKETGLKYITYPASQIDMNWRADAGVDYASTIEIRGRNVDPSTRSEFAIAHGMKTPLGKAVIVGGYAGHVSQAQAEEYTEQAQRLYPNFGATAVEMDGVGAQFYALLRRKPHLRLMPFWAAGRGSKRNRHERELSPWMELGVLMISDADTEYLNKLRKALDDWPNGNMDVIDAVYSYTRCIPDVLIMPEKEDSKDDRNSRKKQRRNPYSSLGTRHVR